MHCGRTTAIASRRQFLRTAACGFGFTALQSLLPAKVAKERAEKYLTQDAVNAWSMIGRSACALGNEEKANEAIRKVNDRSARGDIVYFCVGKGFAYSIAGGTLSKRGK